jgi:hypothetical protein
VAIEGFTAALGQNLSFVEAYLNRGIALAQRAEDDLALANCAKSS